MKTSYIQRITGVMEDELQVAICLIGIEQQSAPNVTLAFSVVMVTEERRRQ